MISLIYKGNVISSITYEVNTDKKIIEISASTDKKYEGNRFYKLLLCISIIILSEYNESQSIDYTLYANSVNKISGWLLLQSYEGITDLPIENFKKKHRRKM